ncbi:unnamed protein product [Zymoseptoria tritici ST99CH_1A5]|uniref:Uncharacterized protein n=1 Tax=Zymoseptoria tritici ST99CH_1A5 TaxID=1276529 RepID=A0A1Y6LC05_ZYMTR|nr:unnamed protein product [Zymoseptoria tritici ST99CH_1A5]
MSPTYLNLFPAPAMSTGMPRKSSLKKTKNNNTPHTNGEVKLNGVAFRVMASPKSPIVQPAKETIKHALFCDPPTGEPRSTSPASATTYNSTISNRGPLRRQSRARRPSSLISNGSPAITNDSCPHEEDELTALPTNTQFGSTSPPRRSLSSHLKRSNTIKTTVVSLASNDLFTPITDDDNLSPLPSKTRFQPTTPSLPGYSPPMRSMFPRYDPSRPLDGQQYYPTARAPSPATFDSDKVSKIGSPIERHSLKRYDSAVGLVNGYEHIPAAGHADLEAVWKASCEEFPCEGRKVQFGLHQPASGTAIAIGTSLEDLIFSMETDTQPIQPDASPAAPKQFTVNKHNPTAPSSTQVAQLTLPEHTTGITSTKESSTTTIFPQAAALAAIASISNSPQAQAIATFDPTASSPEAARMAQDAVAVAFSRYCCDLTKRTRVRDSLGSVVAHYDLRHPTLGVCAVTVTKSQSEASNSGPRAKIAVHHPSATPAAVSAETLELAFLDFAHDACVLDLPGLLALDSHFVIDTVVCALLAVAVIENDALVREMVTFEAPPKTPVGFKGKSGVEGGEKKWFKRTESKKRREKQRKVVKKVKDEDELPGLARATIAVAGFGLKAAVWVVGTGVKVTAKVVIGVGKAVVK